MDGNCRFKRWTWGRFSSGCPAPPLGWQAAGILPGKAEETCFSGAVPAEDSVRPVEFCRSDRAPGSQLPKLLEFPERRVMGASCVTAFGLWSSAPESLAATRVKCVSHPQPFSSPAGLTGRGHCGKPRRSTGCQRNPPELRVGRFSPTPGFWGSLGWGWISDQWPVTQSTTARGEAS